MTRDNIIKALDKFPTPLYVFEAEKLTDRVDYLKKSLPSGVSLCYAVKANTFVVKELIGHVDRFEICSPGEAYICDAQAVPRAEMVISGVYKDPHFIEELFAKGEKVGHFTAESKEQFELIRFLSEKYKIKTKLLLRLSSGNQFGMDNSVLCEIIKNRSEYEYLDICGVQYFSGTQKTSIKKLRREIRQLDNLITKLRSDFDYDCRELEIGPGFPACYFPEDEFDEDELLRGFSEALNEMENRPKISLELGRSIAASCGSFLTRIVDKKTNCCENYAIVDGGIHQLVYFGQMMAMKKPYHSLYPERQGEPTPYNICGALCTTADILVKQLPLICPENGDAIIFENTGAYSVTEGISLFLSRDLPTVVILEKDGKFTCVREAMPTHPINNSNYGG